MQSQYFSIFAGIGALLFLIGAFAFPLVVRLLGSRCRLEWTAAFAFCATALFVLNDFTAPSMVRIQAAFPPLLLLAWIYCVTFLALRTE